MMRRHGTTDEATFWRSRQQPGLELMTARWVRHTFSKHAHDCFTIGINVTGEGVFDCRGAAHRARPGMLNLIAPGEVHTGRATGPSGWTYVDFYIDDDRMLQLAGAAGVRRLSGFRAAAVHDPDLARSFLQVFSALRDKASTQLERESRLILAFRLLHSRHADGCGSDPVGAGRESRTVSRVRDYLRDHLAEEIPVTALAASVGWSPCHLIRVFHREVGMPPHAYQNSLRISTARDLLRRGTTIAEVALACGFCDQSHMNRVFRRVMGTTPGRYSR